MGYLKRFFILERLTLSLLFLLLFALPIERKYDKAFRFFSLTLIPDGISLPSYFDKMIYYYPSDLIVPFLIVLSLYAFRRSLREVLLGSQMTPLWIVLFLSGVSIATSPLAYYPVLYIRLLQLFTPIALFALFAHAIPNHRRVQVVRLAMATLLLAGTMQSTIAITQYFHQKQLGLKFLSEVPFDLSDENTPSIEVTEGRRWLVDVFFPRETKTRLILRASGTLPHPNVLGGFLALTLMCTTFFIYEQRKKTRLFLSLLYFLQLFALATTYSRAAIFAWALASCLFLGFTYRLSGRSIRFASGTMVASVFLIALLFHEPYLKRGGIVNYAPAAKASDQVRFYYQNVAFQMIHNHPLTGVGFRQFALQSTPYVSQRSNIMPHMAVHNIYLLLASESGLLALGAFLFWIGSITLAFFRSKKEPLTIALFATFSGFLFIGMCDLYPIAFHQGTLMFFSLAGFLSCLIEKKKEFKEPSRLEIHHMFDEISSSYDRINRILSLGLDRNWRRQAALYLPPKEGLHLLDLATGTADQLIALFEAKAPIESAIGIDLSQEMLLIGEKKVQNKSYGKRIELQIGDALTIPFDDLQFDACTFSFGIRNVKDPLLSLKEIHRILKSEGRCLVLEFSLPPFPIRPFYLLYLRYLLPWLGNKLSRHKRAYSYLNETIETFPSGNSFLSLMQKAGFTHLQKRQMALGAVTLYVGEK